MGRGDTCHNRWSYQGFTQYVSSYMRSFLSECHISFCYFLNVEYVRGHEFWAHLKMFIIRFDLLAFILNNGTVNCEMGSEVALMPVVIKFGQND